MNKLNFVLLTLSVLLVSSLASTGLTNAPRIHVKDGTSWNWAGYAVQTSLVSPQSGAVTDVKGTWIVPKVDCSNPQTAWSSFWIGIDGYSSGTVEQIGTDSDCSSGSPRYYAWYEMYPKFSVNVKMTITQEDKMFAEVRYLGNGKFQLTVTDLTTGKSFSTTQKSSSAKMSSAEWIAEAPWQSGILPLANFGTVSFTSAQATLNGHIGSISDTAWKNDAMTMVTSSGIVKAQPSALSSDGSSFSISWYHS